MPFVKPEHMIALVQTANHCMRAETVPEVADAETVRQAVQVCPVCGAYDCPKDIVKANGVYVHPSDAIDSDYIELLA